MLKKENRLTEKYDFNKVHRISKRLNQSVRNKFFYLNYLYPTNEESLHESKIGFIVNNKFSKSAPVRNKVKRIFREITRLNLDKIKKPCFIVIHPKKDALTASYEEISAELIKVLQNLPLPR